MRFRWTEKVNLRVLLACGILIATALMLRAQGFKYWPRILEACFYLGGLSLLLASRQLRQTLRSLPRVPRLGLLWLVVLMVTVQVLNQRQNTFPVIAWAMYTKQMSGPPCYYEYIGICEDGREVVVPSMHVFRSQHRTMPWRLEDRMSKLDAAETDTERVERRHAYQSLLSAMVKRFDQQHPELEIQRVRIVRCTMPRPKPGLKLDVTRVALCEYAVR